MNVGTILTILLYGVALILTNHQIIGGVVCTFAVVAVPAHAMFHELDEETKRRRKET